jgi:two-component system chemotaxis response regulator CheY
MTEETNPLILLIEDQKFFADLFRHGFDQYRIVTAESGREGVKRYIDAQPDVTFIDIGLPDISGLEVLKQIRQLDPKAYVVMLSAMNNEAYVKKSRELGAAGFLSKPYNKDYITHYIEQFNARSAG